MRTLLSRSLVVLVSNLCLAAACGTSATAPSPAPPPTPAAGPPPLVLSGAVADTLGAQPLAGVTIDIGGQSVATDAGGAFRYEWPSGLPRPLYTVLRLEGPDIVGRSLTVSLPDSRHVDIDAIRLDSGFDLAYYRQLVRDDFDAPGALESLRRWTQAPTIYIRTLDEQGEPVDGDLVDLVESVLRDDPEAWTGGLFGIAGIERGPETRAGVSGWITVRWPDTDAFCGRAQVAIDGGWIEFSRREDCACRGVAIEPAIIRHELGHAMGFYHTDDEVDVMHTPVRCGSRPSARERLHATIAYRRPVGNTDPDDDPQGLFHGRIDEPVVIVD